MNTDASRRGFLKLLGIGGAAVAVGGPSLFTEAPRGIGDLLVGAADHFVFDLSTRGAKGVRLVPDATVSFLWRPETSWAPDPNTDYASRIMLRHPKRHRGVRTEWAPTGDPSVYQVDCPVLGNEDPHIAFFMAASNLQRKINDDVQSFAKHLRRRSLVMVTTVDTPIMAFPHPSKGFYLEARIAQFAVPPRGIVNRGDAVSTHGEVPFKTPNDIEFKYLMLMQEELRSMGMLTGNEQKIFHQQVREAFRRTQGRHRV